MTESNSHINNNLEEISREMFKRKLGLSILLPLIFICILWIVRFVEHEFGISLTGLGIYPRSIKGLHGIITSPFIHENISHLYNNSLPLFILGSTIFYFYSEVAFRVILYSWIMTGILVWLSGRSAWHIGASGLVYSFSFFVFVSGVIRRYFRLLALSLLVVFLYGSMVWGMFPFVDLHISWEAHMMGAFSGIIMALWFRKEGPQKPPEPEWLTNEDDNEIINDETLHLPED